MKSIIWLKLNDNKVIRGVIITSILISIGFFCYIKMGIDMEKIIGFLPLISVLVFHITTFNEEIFQSIEGILATTIGIRDIWEANSLFVSVIGYLIGELILVIGAVIVAEFQISFICVILNLINLITSILFIKVCTIHYVNYSTILQYIASAFSLCHFIIPFSFPNLMEYFGVDWRFLSIIIGVILSLYIIIKIAEKFESKENLIYNIYKGKLSNR